MLASRLHGLAPLTSRERTPRTRGGETHEQARVDRQDRDGCRHHPHRRRHGESLTEGITSSLKKGQRVTLVGFGTWGTSKRKARIGRNPQTGEAIKIKAKTAVRFKAGKQLDKKINK
jgi:DNA-binding protein HU-beta